MSKAFLYSLIAHYYFINFSKIINQFTDRQTLVSYVKIGGALFFMTSNILYFINQII
jgi:hypothetical protein